MSAITADVGVLSSTTAGDAEKARALKFLGHWVGDVHQPLHVSFSRIRMVDRPEQAGDGS